MGRGAAREAAEQSHVFAIWGMPMKVTRYFKHMMQRPDRAEIAAEEIEAALNNPLRTEVQSDGRIRKWAYIAHKMRYLRVVLLDDGETVHNAFYDRDFKES